MDELTGRNGFPEEPDLAQRATRVRVDPAQGPQFLHHRFVRVSASQPVKARHWRLRLLTSHRVVTAATLGLFLLGLLWRVTRYALAFPVWGDEAFLAISLCERSLAGLSKPLAYWQVAPWGFLAAEHGLIQLLGCSEWALRLLPALCGVASLGLFWRFAVGTLDRRAAMLAVGILAASNYPVRHAAEIKPYAVDLWISLVLTVLGWSLWQDPRSWRHWLALIAVAGVGVWCSFPTVFVAGAVGVLLGARLWSERRRASGETHNWRLSRPLVLWTLYGVVLVASWTAMVIVFAGPLAKAAGPTITAETWKNAYPPLSQPWRLPWWLLEVHTGYMLAYPVGGSGFCSTLTFLCVARGVWVLWRTRQRALLGLLLGPLPLNLLAAALHRYPYGTAPRVALYMAPAFCLLAAVGLASAIRWNLPRRLVPPCLLGVAVLLGLGTMVGAGIDVFKPYYQRDDLAHRQLVRVLAAQAEPSDRWLIYNGPETRPATSTVMLSPWLAQEAELRFYLLQRAPVPLQWVFEPFEPAVTQPTAPGRIWLIVHRSGLPLFPDNVAEAMRQALASRLGAPRTVAAVISRYESVTAHVFPEPGASPRQSLSTEPRTPGAREMSISWRR